LSNRIPKGPGDRLSPVLPGLSEDSGSGRDGNRNFVSQSSSLRPALPESRTVSAGPAELSVQSPTGGTAYPAQWPHHDAGGSAETTQVRTLAPARPARGDSCE